MMSASVAFSSAAALAVSSIKSYVTFSILVLSMLKSTYTSAVPSALTVTSLFELIQPVNANITARAIISASIFLYIFFLPPYHKGDFEKSPECQI